MANSSGCTEMAEGIQEVESCISTSEDEPHELEYGSLENGLTRYLNYIDARKFVAIVDC